MANTERLVQCRSTPGLIPDERAVYIRTMEGHEEEVTLSARQVKGDHAVCWLIGWVEDRSLIELPRETATGCWRLWVPSAHLSPPQAALGLETEMEGGNYGL